MTVQILASKPRPGDLVEVTLFDDGLRLTAQISKSMLASELSSAFLQSIMDRERVRIDAALAAVGTGGDT